MRLLRTACTAADVASTRLVTTTWVAASGQRAESLTVREQSVTMVAMCATSTDSQTPVCEPTETTAVCWDVEAFQKTDVADELSVRLVRRPAVRAAQRMDVVA